MPNTPLLVLLDSTASTLAIGNQAQTAPEPGSEAYVLGYMSARWKRVKVEPKHPIFLTVGNLACDFVFEDHFIEYKNWDMSDFHWCWIGWT